MKKSKKKRIQVMLSADSNEHVVVLKPEMPQIYKRFINYKTMDHVTIASIMSELMIIKEKLEKIEKRLSLISKANANSSPLNGKHLRKRPIQITKNDEKNGTTQIRKEIKGKLS